MLLMLPFLKCSIAYQVFLQVFFMQYLQNKEKEKITVSKESNNLKINRYLRSVRERI